MQYRHRDVLSILYLRCTAAGASGASGNRHADYAFNSLFEMRDDDAQMDYFEE
jgi:hypothetical protein